MSDATGLKEVVVEEVSDQLTVDDLLGDGSAGDGIDGAELGSAVGRRLGEQLGRQLGEAIGRELHEGFERDGEERRDLQTLRADLARAVRDAIGDVVEDAGEGLDIGDGGDSSTPSEEGDEAGGDDESDAETDEGDDETDEGGSEEDGDRAPSEENDETGEEADGETPQNGAEGAKVDAADEPSADDLEGLRRETLSEFLSIMSYADLQSVAKDVGVKANLSREEMTERIVEAVGDSTDELAAPEGDDE